MAFFFANGTTYFSLELDPSRQRPCYVFRLTDAQDAVARYFVKPAFVIALVTFLAALMAVVCNLTGLGHLNFADDEEVWLQLGLGAVATLSAMSEVAFFLWVRAGRGSRLEEHERSSLHSAQLLLLRSRLTYLIFLLDMIVPFILLLAHPGGIAGLRHEISRNGRGNAMLLLLLIGAAVVICIQLVTKIVRFGRRPEMANR